ncbi:hypothetical protein J7M02_00080, partial [Candidatus Aerophobetes bacterium]|nr:hypothetical protein [Candidatus Aerophobetes bacterium]
MRKFLISLGFNFLIFLLLAKLVHAMTITFESYYGYHILKPTNKDYVFINVTTDEPANQCLLEWENQTGTYNLTMENSSATNWYRNQTNLEDCTYKFRVWCENQSGSWSVTGYRGVTVDTTPPLILSNQTDPTSPTLYEEGKTYKFNATFDANVSGVRRVYLEFDGVNYTTTRDEGLVLYLPFEEIDAGWVTPDYSDYGNNGTIYGAVWVNGKFGRALEFDGVDDYVEVPVTSSLEPKNAITIE